MSLSTNQNIELSSVKFQFTQDGNTLGTTEDIESLEICLEYQLDTKAGPFFVLKSTTGWSIDEKEELIKLIDYCKSCHNSFLIKYNQKDISPLDY